jgi:RNA polymerase sigma-32 factor
MDQYMLEVGRIPLLTREEERELTERLRNENDVQAARKLVAANLRFVVKVAFKYRNYNIRMTDLIQEGNVGLMHAVSKFDPERGYRLISYAVWWIKAYIQNYIIKNWSMVPISARRKHLFGRLKSLPSGEVEVDSGQDSDAPPSDSHFLVAAEPASAPSLGVSKTELSMAQRDFSLDSTVHDGSATTHLARLPAPQASQEDELASAQLRSQVAEIIAEVIEDLDDRSRFILEKRLVADEPMSLSDIGRHFNVSRERARQLEARIKKKLKKRLAHLGKTEIYS